MKKIQERLKIKLTATEKVYFIQMLQIFDSSNKEEMNLVFDILFRNNNSLHTILEGSIEIAGVAECNSFRNYMNKMEDELFIQLIRKINREIDIFLQNREINMYNYLSKMTSNNLMLGQ